MDKVGHLRLRTHGSSGPTVIVLHGGPGAVGDAAPMARALADSFRVIEPWQRGSGAESLTVAGHVEDLHELIQARCADSPLAIVGHSWGAMLALAYAAAHPDGAEPLVLVGCGTFDRESRAEMTKAIDERTDDKLRHRLEHLAEEYPDPGVQMIRRYELSERLYSYAPRTSGHPRLAEAFDLRAYTETWNDMIRLQKEGVYPAAFTAIKSPAIMLHGAYDPHPGRMIHASLTPYLPQLEYHQWDRCGHTPWLEKYARDDVFATLHTWLGEHLPQ